MLRPMASNLDDSVHMVRHNDKRMQIDMCEMRRNGNPAFVNDLA